MNANESRTVVRGLGVVAGMLALLGAFTGSPYTSQHARIDVDALAKAVQHEDDHVTAIELAGWIKNRRPGLRVVDVRSKEEFEEYHVPMAERVPLDSLSTIRFAPTETIVLYSDGGAHAAQGWVFLRALGYNRVYFLRGGVNEWLEDVMNPTLRSNALAKDSISFVGVSALSRYFGGTPRIGEPTGLKTRRRGC